VGKTTPLRMLLGLVEPAKGSATICGCPYREPPDPRIGWARCPVVKLLDAETHRSADAEAALVGGSETAPGKDIGAGIT
jgi:hypothetical protein